MNVINAQSIEECSDYVSDEKYLRYYFLEEECDYDSTTNTFKWVAEDYKAEFDRYDESLLNAGFNNDSLKYMISF